MKYSFPWITLVVSVSVLLSCSQSSKKIVEPTAEEQEIIIAKGEAIAVALVQSLKSEVKQAIESKGVEEAIAVCNLEAIPLTNQIEELSGRDISIKRTSFRFRNPENEPDEIETLALSYFEMLYAQGKEIPQAYTHKVMMGTDTLYYYYKPMKMEALCLLCHGGEETIAQGVKGILSTLYPDDRATGYQEGDFRGLIRVKFPHI
ncbi:MAG: DUF3365 domain-containing protein [Bacteroidales bacterium]